MYVWLYERFSIIILQQEDGNRRNSENLLVKKCLRSFFGFGHIMYGLSIFFSKIYQMIVTQHAHIYSFHTSKFYFGEIFVLIFSSIQPLSLESSSPHLCTYSIVAFEKGYWGGKTTLGVYPKIILPRVSLVQLIRPG